MATIAGHRVTRLLVASGIGVALSLYAFHRATDLEPARRRAAEEAMVYEARAILTHYVGHDQELQIVDPLAPDRAIGKVYIYPAGQGFEVSGHYRRNDTDNWHPFLMKLAEDSTLIELAVRDNDAVLQRHAATDPKLRVDPR